MAPAPVTSIASYAAVARGGHGRGALARAATAATGAGWRRASGSPKVVDSGSGRTVDPEHLEAPHPNRHGRSTAVRASVMVRRHRHTLWFRTRLATKRAQAFGQPMRSQRVRAGLPVGLQAIGTPPRSARVLGMLRQLALPCAKAAVRPAGIWLEGRWRVASILRAQTGRLAALPNFPHDPPTAW